MIKLLFFGLDGSFTETHAPLTITGFVLFLVACVGACRNRLDKP